MCGIVGIFDLKKSAEELRGQALSMSRKQRHRGPDWSGISMNENAILVHERLSIVDPTSGKQPLFSADGKLALAVNGEIYNHKEFKKNLNNLTSFYPSIVSYFGAVPGKRRDFFDDLTGIFCICFIRYRKRHYLMAAIICLIPLYRVGMNGVILCSVRIKMFGWRM